MRGARALLAFRRGEVDPESGEPTELAFLGAYMTADYQAHVTLFVDGWVEGAKNAPKPRKR